MLTFIQDSGIFKSTNDCKAVARSVIVDFFIPAFVGVRNQNKLNMVQCRSLRSLVEPRHSQNSVLTKKRKGKEMKIKNLVAVRNNRVITTSTKVAEVFGKEHSKVLRSIADLSEAKKGLADNLVLFTKTTYKDMQGKLRPCYNLTRDGFALLVMGFTGKKALEFKLAYIDAFNKMEAKLRKQSPTQPDLFVAPSSKKSVISFDRLSLAQLFKEAQDENVAYQIDHFHHREFIEATEAIRKFGIACYDLGTLDAVYNLKEKGRIKEER